MHLILPPILWTGLGKARLWWRLLTNRKSTGYLDPDLNGAVIEKNLAFKAKTELGHLDLMSLRGINGIGFTGLKQLRVMDFGGGAGSHYYTALRVFPKVDLDWTIVENKSLVARLNQLDNLDFSVSESISQLISEKLSFDLAILSSSIQYTENPLDTLEEVIRLNPEFIYITRTALSDYDFGISLQQFSRLGENGPGTSNHKKVKKGIVHRMTAVNRNTFENVLRDRYDIQLYLEEDMSSHKYKGKYLKYYGYFCVRKPS